MFISDLEVDLSSQSTYVNFEKREKKIWQSSWYVLYKKMSSRPRLVG